MDWATGKHALITGGGTGIGAATAEAFAKAGAKVTVMGRRPEPLEAVATSTGGTAVSCDLTDRAAMQEAFAKARDANGPFDFVVLNAGVADSAPFLKTSRESWDRIIATNLTALFDGAQLALPDLLEGTGKRLVILASVAGLKGGPLFAPYAASKHGAVGLMKCLALEYAQTNLTVNAVCPAFVDTPMVDESVARVADRTKRSLDESRQAIASLNANGRLIPADEVASAILYLCHPKAQSVTGTCLTIDGGTTA